MNDLFKRADLAIRESRIVRDEIQMNLMDARIAAARALTRLRQVRIEQETSVNFYREAASRAFASLGERTISSGGTQLVLVDLGFPVALPPT